MVLVSRWVASGFPGREALPRSAQAARDRDRRLRVLVERYYDPVWRTLCRLGVPPQDADDACQRVFVVASRRVEDIETAGERAYLMAIAVRVASDARRALRRRREEPTDDAELDCVDPAGTPEALLAQKRARAVLDDILGTLPFELRTVFVLHEIEGLTLPEIAASEEIPLGTATSRLRRAREIFRARCAGQPVGRGPEEGYHE